jgi:hypothetical protein
VRNIIRRRSSISGFSKPEMNRNNGSSRRQYEKDESQESKQERAEPGHWPDDQPDDPVNDIEVNQVKNVRRFSFPKRRTGPFSADTRW